MEAGVISAAIARIEPLGRKQRPCVAAGRVSLGGVIVMSAIGPERVASNGKNFAISQREQRWVPTAAAIGLARLEVEVTDTTPGADARMIDPAAVFSQEVQVVAMSLVLATPLPSAATDE